MTDDIAVFCTYCGRSQGEVRALVPGPAVFICDRCVGDAVASLCTGEQPSTAQERLSVRAESGSAYCMFCGKPAVEVRRMMARGSANICDECLMESVDILLEGTNGVRGVQKF
jgi:ATP-dependent protease Clp ATPase subunit